MGIEIERKFLVSGEGWRGGKAESIRQGYLSTDPDRVVRVRVSGDTGYLTVKGRSHGARRVEVELEIPRAQAAELLALCKGALIEKTRHHSEHSGFAWVVDEFLGDCAGLLVAELEVSDESDFARALTCPPAWLGRDVTDDPRLSNSALSERPFASWGEAERRALS